MNPAQSSTVLDYLCAFHDVFGQNLHLDSSHVEDVAPVLRLIPRWPAYFPP